MEKIIISFHRKFDRIMCGSRGNYHAGFKRRKAVVTINGELRDIELGENRRLAVSVKGFKYRH